MLEKKKTLKKIEFTFTDDKVNPTCLCEYELEVLENGKSLMGRKHVEESDANEMRSMVSSADVKID